jgi:hypothetical protein
VRLIHGLGPPHFAGYRATVGEGPSESWLRLLSG